MVGIYKITSPSNKVYIGQSWNVTTRLSTYYSLNTNKGQKAVYRSLTKHGVNSHKFEVICELPEDVTQEVLDRYEILYWQTYKDCGFIMLNIKNPGKGGKHSKETKRKISLGQIFSYLANPKRKSILTRKIYQYNLSGYFIKEFNSIKEASQSSNLSTSYIISCARGRISKSPYFLWSYEFKENILRDNCGVITLTEDSFKEMFKN